MRGEEVAAGELREHLQEEEKRAYIHIHFFVGILKIFVFYDI
jgi:hypothetical protein